MRKRRKTRARRPELRPEARAVLRGEPCPEGGNRFRHLALRGCHIDDLALAWEHWGSELLAEWITARPGTRPVGFWAFDAPQMAPREHWRQREAQGNRLYQGAPPEKEQARLLRKYDLLDPEELKAIQAT